MIPRSCSYKGNSQKVYPIKKQTYYELYSEDVVPISSENT